MLFLLSIVFNFNSTFAESVNYDVIIDPTLNLTLSSNTVSFNLNPVSQAFNSGNLTTTVSTNNPNGYKLYLNANTTDLVRQNDGTPADSLGAVIETLSNSIAESNFPVNKWGYRISSGTSGDSTITSTTNYYPFTSGKLISSTIEPTNNESATLSFAASANYNKPAGQYNLSLDFKALPQVTQKYMQEIETADCTEDPTMVMDKRDGHLYAIARLKDGKCWMVQNLRLGENLESVTGSLTLTDQDTDISSNDTYNPRSEFVLTNKLTDGKMPRETGEGWTYDAPAFYCTEYGCYYNWYTATAGVLAEGADAVITQNTDITTSICPKGWTLPTGGTITDIHLTTDIKNLVDAYGGSGSVGRLNILVNPNSATENTNGFSAPGFTIGGRYYSTGYTDNNLGFYWTGTVRHETAAYSLYITPSGVSIADGNARLYGMTARCLLRE